MRKINNLKKDFHSRYFHQRIIRILLKIIWVVYISFLIYCLAMYFGGKDEYKEHVLFAKMR